MPDATSETILHASCVTLHGRGALIVGASGSGKSGLALELMARGASLVSDDRVILTRRGGTVLASAPAAISGLIEARGIGLLPAAAHGPVPVHVVIDMDRTEKARLPEAREVTLLGHSFPLLCRVESPHFPAALVQYLTAGHRRV